MKINIIFPYNTWSGAFRSTYELANRMAERGEDVEIYFPFFPHLQGASLLSGQGLNLLGRGLVRSIVRRNCVPWFDVKVPLKMVPTFTDHFIRDADVIVANHWPTAYSVAKLSPKKGRKFYFIRDIDWWTHKTQLDLELAASQLPLGKIVVAPWLGDELREKLGVDVLGTVSNGMNMEDFGVTEKQYNDDPVLCMTYSDHPAKGMDDGMAALRIAKERHPRVKIVLFGLNRPGNLPFDAEFHFRPAKDRLRKIYAGTDIFLSSSLQEGYHNPPREAMAARCAVVATNVGSIPHCTIPGETALVVNPGDVDGMADAMCNLIEHPEKLREMGRRGHEHIQQFTWEKSVDRLLQILTGVE
jgi:hypothetical protein